MSWDKNTLNFSVINATLDILRDLGEPFVLSIIGNVMGNGINDEEWTKDEDGDPYPQLKYYPIHRLEYKNTVILEQIQRTQDCDCNDTIISFKFKKEEEPTNWEIDITLPDSAYDYPEPDDESPCGDIGEEI
jgi:hypothetical protein